MGSISNPEDRALFVERTFHVSCGIGSLLGATVLLPYARAKATSNLLTILAGALLVAVLGLMAIVQNLAMLLPAAALAGVSWTVSASELLPDNDRSRIGSRTDLLTPWDFSLPGRRNSRASRHFPDRNAGQLLGRAPQAARPHDKGRD
jgi:hypothetical protein